MIGRTISHYKLLETLSEKNICSLKPKKCK